MTHAQAVLLVTPISLAMVAWALLKMLELTLPLRPQPVYLANGTVNRLAEAITKAAPPTGSRIGLVDADGYPIIHGERFVLPMKDFAGCHIVAVRGEYREENEVGRMTFRQKVKVT